MRMLSTAASAAFVAVALTTSAVPAARPRSPGHLAKVSLTQPAVAQMGAGPIITGAPRVTAEASVDAAQVAPRAAFAWPLFPTPVVVRPFDRPADQWSPGHRGVDLSAEVGQPVLSAGEGVVAFSGAVAGRGVLTVQHSGELRTTYEPVDERLASGTIVHRGTRVGVLSASPGHCAPRGCLHWGAISGESYLDPLSLLGYGRPILLPLG